MNVISHVFLLIVILLCTFACNANKAKRAVLKTQSPVKYNILYIMTDDHAAHALGAYGGRLASLNPTPNLDKLASEGMLFNNTFVTNSICTPSRASILTGQYSQSNGVLDLEGSLAKEQQHLPRLMGQAGYQTAIIGKWHLKKEPAAFDYYEVLESQGDYFDPTFRVRAKHPWPKNETKYIGHSSDVITNLSIDWLKNREKNKPFFLMHQFKAPHDYFEYAPRYEDYLADVDIPEPTDLYQLHAQFGSIATRGKEDKLLDEIGTTISQRNARRSLGIDLGVDPTLPSEEFTRQSYQTFLKAYLRCVKGVDDNIARLIQALKDMGEYDNTIIIYTSDQGMMLGEHDYQDKRWIFDPSIKMPLIVRHPDMPKKGQISELIINNTDYAPFMLSLAGIDKPDFMQGESFTSELFGNEPQNWRTASYYRYWTHRAYHDVPAHFGLRSKDFKLIFFYGSNYMTTPSPFYDEEWLAKGGTAQNAVNTPAAWELYDLRNDPNETVNVYADDGYVEVIAELKVELQRQRKAYNETDDNYPHLQAIIDKHWND